MTKLLRLGALFAALSLVIAPLAAAPAYAADLTITVGNVIAGADARIDRSYNAGEAITAGQAVYRAAATSKWMKADADSATAEVRQATGVALHAASLNQPLAVQTGGSITIGATVTAGAPYSLSGTAGGVAPTADLSTGEYVDLIGLATSTSVLKLVFAYTGVATP